MYLVGDIGGTNSRLALAEPGTARSGVKTAAMRAYSNNDFPSLENLVFQYLETEGRAAQVTHAGLCVAAPVVDDWVCMPNRDWQFSIRTLGENLHLNSLKVINDFAAVAMALPFLQSDQIKHLGGGGDPSAPRAGKTMGVLGPGTGLGVSGIIPHAAGWSVMHGEGGHVTLAATSTAEEHLLGVLRARFGHVSAERVICGSGLGWLHDAMTDHPLAELPSLHPRDITGSDTPAARRTVDQFLLFLGAVAGDLALTLGALGGIFVAGGVAQKIEKRFQSSGFRARFEDKGRYASYLARIPTWLITDEVPALSGLAAHLDGEI